MAAQIRWHGDPIASIAVKMAKYVITLEFASLRLTRYAPNWNESLLIWTIYSSDNGSIIQIFEENG